MRIPKMSCNENEMRKKINSIQGHESQGEWGWNKKVKHENGVRAKIIK